MNKEIIKELLEKLKQCDDFHNRCDFLMEHSEITYMLDYITKLQQENKQLEENYDRIYNENCILRENAEHNDKVVDRVNWENLKLKKQLEEYKRLGFEHLNDKSNKLENQQKEFIEWLENEKNIYPYDISDYTYEDIINTILSKYEEIIDKLESGE